MQFGGKLLSGLSFVEKAPESPDEAWGTNASRTRRTYVVTGDAGNRLATARALLGYATLNAEKVNGRLQYFVRRNLPHALDYQDANKNPYLYAAAIARTTPVGVGRKDATYAGLSAYTKAFIEVEYRTHSFAFKEDDAVLATDGTLTGYPDEGNALKHAAAAGPGTSPLTASRYVTRVFQPGSRFFEINAGMMRFVDDANPANRNVVPRGIPVTEPWVSCLYTWNMVPVGAYPAKAVEQNLGRVNDDYFDGFYPGTLLFESVHPQPSISPFGDRILDVGYAFKYLPAVNRAGVPLGHNAIYRTVVNNGGTMDYVRISDNGLSAGRAPYLKGDLSALFRPDQDLS